MNKHNFEELRQKSDFELRKLLNGFGIGLASYVGQFYEFGTAEYNSTYKELFEQVRELRERANKGLNSYEVTVKYKQKGKADIFNYAGSYEERNEEEVKQRLAEKVWSNLITGRKITPEFLAITISPALK